MKTVDIKHLKIAKKYAKALLLRAKEQGDFDRIYNDIVFISETIKENKQLSLVLLNPVITVDDKKEILKKLFSIHVTELTLDFMYLLIESSRLDCFNEIIDCYNQLKNEEQNIITPIIISAVELSNEQKLQVVSKIEQKTKKKVLPQYSIDPEIIGGIIIEIDDRIVDCSLLAKFKNMRKQLIKGNSYGNN